MSTNRANLLMLVATLIWGTAFVSQTTGMGSIGPFTFSFSRFLLAMLTVLPLALIYERNNFSLFYKNTNLIYLSLLAGLALFGGMGLQQYALLESQIANAAFLSTLYVPIVSLISRFIFRSRLHWIMWIAVLLCLYGSYLLSSNQTLDIQQSDALLFIAAFFFAIHIILIDIFIKQFYSPFTFGFIQYTIVFLCSLIIAFIFESPTIANIKIEWFDGYSGDEFKLFLNKTLKDNSEKIGSGSKVHIYIESPSNPEGYVLDVPEISKISHAKGLQVSLDATVATPFLYKPLQRDLKTERPDYIVHSYTKDIAGHGTTTAGCVIGENHNMFTPKGMTVNEVSWEKTMFWNVYYIKGAFLDSDKSFEVLTGMKTLHQRMLQKCINTATIAKVFSKNKFINVNCNAIEGHKNNSLKNKLLKYGLPAPLFTMDFEGINLKNETFKKFFDSLTPMFNMHISLGQTNTTITCPALTTHSEMDETNLKLTGLYLTTMRISVGDENPKELINHFIASAKRSIKHEFPDFVAAFPSKEEIDKIVTKEYMKYHKNYIDTL